MVELESAVWEYDCRRVVDFDDTKKLGKPQESSIEYGKLMLLWETSLREIFANLAY